MDQELTHIWVGGRKIGVVGLERVFAEVRELGSTDPVRVMAELLRRARRNNYVPLSAEREYCNALYEGYRRYLGEDALEDHGMLEIRVLGPGCPRCEELMRRVKNAVAEMNLAADIEHVRDLKQIAAYGPAPTPVLVVDSKVRVSGRVPSVTELKALLSE